MSTAPLVASTQPAAPPVAAEPNQPVAPAPTAPAPKADEQRPAFDVVRVEPTGDAVIAGRASPRAAVQLRSDGRVVAQANADDSGQFAILPPPFSAGGHRLQLAARSDGAPEVLSDAVGIEVPAAAEASAPSAPAAPAASMAPATKKRVEEPARVAAAAPEPQTKAAAHSGTNIASLTAAPVVNATSAPRVSVLSVEADGAGRLEAKGAAEPNAIVRLYLNNSLLAEAKASADGRWSLTVERGMTPGAYTIRADQIDRSNGAVSARAEVPFNYPERASAPLVASAAPPVADNASPPLKPGAPLVASVERSLAGAGAAGEVTKPSPATGTDQHAAEPRKTIGGAISVTIARTPGQTSSAAPAGSGASGPASQASKPQPEEKGPAVAAAQPQKTSGAAISVTIVKTPDRTPSAAPAGPDTSAPAEQASTPEPAKGPAVAAAEPEKPQTKEADAVVPEIRTAKVVPGDNLWDLSEHFYGYGPHYRVIYEANASQIRNPRLIYPDQIFVVPQKPVD